MTTPLPNAHDYVNTQPYAGRGWCKAEERMSVITKDQTALIDLSKLQGDETSYDEIIAKGKADRLAPMAPEAFHKMLTEGVKDGSIKFTNRGDVDLVARIYERAFLDEMTTATALYYQNLGWGDEQVAMLSAALVFAHARGALPALVELYLQENAIGDEGMISFSEALGRGALPALVELYLSLNKISDVGLTSFSEALGRGALPALTDLVLDGNLIGDAGLKSFSEALGRGALPALKEFYIGGNKIGDTGMKSFSEVLASGALAKLQV